MSSLIDLNNIREACRYCKGTGIVRYPQNDVGTICSSCRGKGYYIIDAGFVANISKGHDISGDVYYLKTIHNSIRTFISFNRIVVVKDVKYVAFANGGMFGSARQWYTGDFYDGRVVTYEEYLGDKFPLPDEKVLCPENFYDYPFDIVNKSCTFNCIDCQRKICWDKFYEGCNSLEERQKHIGTKVRSLAPRKTLW